jgi:hypothetical protein
MAFVPPRIKTIWPARLLVLFSLLSLSQPFVAQRSAKKTSPRSDVQQELVRTEIGFFEAWKTKDAAYFQGHMTEDGISWGETGALSREQQLQQLTSAKACNVEGYGLSDFGVLPVASGAYLLTYKVDQYATCNGERLPVHRYGSSVYVLRSGHWQAIYRAQIPNLVP